MKTIRRERGVFERPSGSGVWWVRHVDADGRLRREKAGTKSAAIDLYKLRKADALRGKKLPKKLHARMVRFAELADDYLVYAMANNLGKDADKNRIKKLREVFGDRPAEVPIGELREWFQAQPWAPGTFNRWRTVLELIFKLGMENKKVESNPARLLKHQREPEGRVRFLNQFEPDEESRLRKVILEHYPQHMPEFEIALNTGMRRSEQYRRINWRCVDFLQRDLFIPESKTGKSRHIDLTDEALAAFQQLRTRTGGCDPIFSSGRGGKQLLGARHWFEDAISKAEIKDFTWHCLRHTFASRLVMAGVDLRTVAEWMGHATIQMTSRYAHLAKAHKRNALAKLSAYNAAEKTRQKAEEAAILAPVAPAEPTGTSSGTDEKITSATASEIIQ